MQKLFLELLGPGHLDSIWVKLWLCLITVSCLHRIHFGASKGKFWVSQGDDTLKCSLGSQGQLTILYNSTYVASCCLIRTDCWCCRLSVEVLRSPRRGLLIWLSVFCLVWPRGRAAWAADYQTSLFRSEEGWFWCWDEKSCYNHTQTYGFSRANLLILTLTELI